MNETFKYDFLASTNENYTFWKSRKALIKMHALRFIYCYRISTLSKNPFRKAFFNFIRFKLRRKYGLEINKAHIGRGFRIVHGFNITISDKAILGKNVTIFKGAVIGESFRGLKKGAPYIKNNVWIGPNVAVVGAVTIGNDVLIASNSFVNFDVPDHSVVVGNPGKIYHKTRATDGYLY
jgi:serine O-acetyltransferase